MSGETSLHQRVGGDARPAGRVPDGAQLSAWLKSLPKGAYREVARLVKDGVSDQPAALESELIAAFLAHGPAAEARPSVEALLLAVLGCDPAADALGFAEHLPLAPARNPLPEAASILDRAVQVGERTWKDWPEERRRREYLLLEFYDAILGDAQDEGRDERVATTLRLLQKPNPKV